jgi:hypothetical protein
MWRLRSGRAFRPPRAREDPRWSGSTAPPFFLARAWDGTSVPVEVLSGAGSDWAHSHRTTPKFLIRPCWPFEMLLQICRICGRLVSSGRRVLLARHSIRTPSSGAAGALIPQFLQARSILMRFRHACVAVLFAVSGSATAQMLEDFEHEVLSNLVDDELIMRRPSRS